MFSIVRWPWPKKKRTSKLTREGDGFFFFFLFTTLKKKKETWPWDTTESLNYFLTQILKRLCRNSSEFLDSVNGTALISGKKNKGMPAQIVNIDFLKLVKNKAKKNYTVKLLWITIICFRCDFMSHRRRWAKGKYGNEATTKTSGWQKKKINT